MNLTIMVSGVQLKNGIDTTSSLIARSFKAIGAEVRISKDYLSTIQGLDSPGGTSAYKIRVKDSKIDCIGDDQCDVLICLGLLKPDGTFPYSALNYLDKIKPGGFFIYDPSQCREVKKDSLRQKIHYFPIPAKNLAKELTTQDPTAPVDKLKNSALIGALLWLAGCNDTEKTYDYALEKVFPGKIKVQEQNRLVCAKGFKHAQSLGDGRAPYEFSFHKETAKDKLLITGNEAITLGALAANAKFFAGYPITPASGILEGMQKYGSRFGAVTLQAEDEIAAASMVMGAGFVGQRAFTATSGPGFNLMVEIISHAGMIETPLVIVLSQRAGPSTGMPTKTEQSDLWLAIHGNNGEIPRIVLAPGDATEAFNAMVRAFYLAEKYQCPIVVMSTLDLSESWEMINSFNLTLVKEYWEERILPIAAGQDPNVIVLKHQLTENHLSPLFLPQYSGAIKTNGVEHTESGSVTTDPKTRNEMMKKRMGKMETFLKEDAWQPFNYGSANARITLIGWGDTKGALKEAQQILELKHDLKTKVCHFVDVWPFPTEKTLELLHPEDLNIVFENNYSGQFADLLTLECAKKTGKLFNIKRYNRYDGKVLEPQEIMKAVLEYAGLPGQGGVQ